MQGALKAALSSEQPVKDTDWGFATKLPAVQTLLLQTSDQPRQSDINVDQHGSGDLAA